MNKTMVEQYINKADGKHLVYFNPNLGTVQVEKILVSTKRNNEIRIVTDTPYIEIAYKLNGNEILWMGYLNGLEKALAATPGTEFKGWKRTKQYRLTDNEISDLVKDKIFVYGGVDH